MRARSGRSARSGGGAPFRPLSAAAREAAARAGARLAVFAAPGDRLWLVGRPPEGTAIPDTVEVVTGAPEDQPAADEILAWGEDARVAALRRRGRTGGAAGPDPLALPLIESLWRLPVPAPEIVAAVAHRRFAFELAEGRGWTLPGAGLAEDPAEVERLARAAGAASGGPWVAKGAWSAAGRERVFGERADDVADPAVRRRLEELLARHGALVVEPWVDRTADFGCAGLVSVSGARIETLHALEVDRRGAFRGTVPLPSDFAPLAAAERARIEEAFHAAADALAGAGYTGPFGIDAFRWRPADGGPERLQPLVEINPRLTFGLVARAEEAARHGT